MMFPYSKSQSSPSSNVPSCLFYMLAITTTILIQSSNRSNYLVEAFAQQKFTGPSRIVSQTVTETSASLSSSSLRSTVPSSFPRTNSTTDTYPDHLTNDFVGPSLPDDDNVFSSITTDQVPSIIGSKRSQVQEKKKKLWHQDTGLESKLILGICSYHVMKLMLDVVHLS
eukprot:CAMPEP_0170778410 /NCGR_PEP_ID=MMETSP0733-20121128/12376_1 /TAXON_ID=186038 /ORGANISM="Fragilariopsis kerguelensis, Strain L26-C5" /LENGTH=168 /DNA_ID=CAMNT_0011121831 /DNA_START=139 /DNA_END=648 /DNA_ORIENTATION=+